MITLLCPEPWTPIAYSLYIGGHDYQPADSAWPLAAVVVDEFDLVISLYTRDGHGPADSTLHVFHRLPDGPLKQDALADVRVLADWATEAVRAGQRVLCRCQAGLNRSSLVAAFTLLRLGHKPDEAIDLIRRRRSPQALFNYHFQQYIADEARRLEATA